MWCLQCQWLFNIGLKIQIGHVFWELPITILLQETNSIWCWLQPGGTDFFCDNTWSPTKCRCYAFQSCCLAKKWALISVCYAYRNVGFSSSALYIVTSRYCQSNTILYFSILFDELKTCLYNKSCYLWLSQWLQWPYVCIISAMSCKSSLSHTAVSALLVHPLCILGHRGCVFLHLASFTVWKDIRTAWAQVLNELFFSYINVPCVRCLLLHDPTADLRMLNNWVFAI